LARAEWEKYTEWLERLQIPVEDTATLERFQRVLEGQIEVTPARVEALWEAVRLRYEELAPRGVRPAPAEYKWGRVMRWAISGYPGFWGPEEMVRITGWRPPERLLRRL